MRGPSERGLCLPFHLRSKLLVHCHSFCPGQKPTWDAVQLHGDPPPSWPLPPGPFLPCLCGLSCTRGPGGAGPCVSSPTRGVWRDGEAARVGESCRKSVLGLEEMRMASEAGEEEGQGRGFKDTSSADSYSHSQALGSTPCPGNAGREGILEAAAKVTPHPTPCPLHPTDGGSFLLTRLSGGLDIPGRPLNSWPSLSKAVLTLESPLEPPLW